MPAFLVHMSPESNHVSPPALPPSGPSHFHLSLGLLHQPGLHFHSRCLLCIPLQAARGSFVKSQARLSFLSAKILPSLCVALKIESVSLPQPAPLLVTSSTISAPLFSILTSLPFLDTPGFFPTLHWLFPVPGTLFLQISHGDQPIGDNHPPSCPLSRPSFYCLHRTYCHWKFMFVCAGFCLCHSLRHTQACSIGA